MKAKHRWLGTALLLSCSTALYAQAEPVDLRSQISLMGTYTFDDSKRESKEGLGATLGYQFNLGQRWGLELAGFWQDFDNDPRAWREWGGNIDALYHFSRNPRFSPYAVIGAGAMRLDQESADTRSTEPFGHAGLGFKSLLTNRFGIRADARFRYIDVDDDKHGVARSSFREPILRLGLFMPLGAAPAAAPPPPPPPAEPAPPPPPPPAPPPAAEPELIFEFDNGVLFDFDSADLRQEARSALDAAAADIRQDASLARVEIGGHTDDMGPAAYNKGLSQRRAQSVYDYLVSQGVDSGLLTVQGYGEERPKYPNDSIPNRQRNRRVEITVLERR